MNFSDMQKYFDLIEKGRKSEAESLREKSIPDKLIKFIWLDGSINDKKKFDSLMKEQLWLSSIKKVNDPYEFRGMILDDKEMQEKGYSKDVIDKCKKEFNFDEFGITCLSARDINYLPMWAYYTNNYKGFCIEYELKSKACVHEVMYEPKRIPVTSLFFQLKEVLNNANSKDPYYIAEKRRIAKIFFQQFYIKSKSWKHEKEYRIVQPISNLEGENIEISKLGLRTSRIVAGINCSKKNLKILNEISNQIGCGNVYVSRLSETDYTLIDTRM